MKNRNLLLTIGAFLLLFPVLTLIWYRLLVSLDPQTDGSQVQVTAIITPSNSTGEPLKTVTISPIPSPKSQSRPDTDQTAALGPSKLGIFLLSGYSQGGQDLVALHPKVIKVMDPHLVPDLARAVREYRGNPMQEGIVILRIGKKIPQFAETDDPVTSAQEYYDQVIQPALTQIGSELSQYSYLESPNEVEISQDWSTVEKTKWNTAFWVKLIELYKEAGIATCAGSIPVGNPGGEGLELQAKYDAMRPLLDAILANNGALCYHGYTTEYTADVGVEYWYSLRYRNILQEMAKRDPKYLDVPVVISESGVDQSGDPKTSGWSARGSADQYMRWLKWYDSEIKKDKNVIGVTLFQIGDTFWSSFDLETLAGDLVRYIRSSQMEL